MFANILMVSILMRTDLNLGLIIKCVFFIKFDLNISLTLMSGSLPPKLFKFKSTLQIFLFFRQSFLHNCILYSWNTLLGWVSPEYRHSATDYINHYLLISHFGRKEWFTRKNKCLLICKNNKIKVALLCMCIKQWGKFMFFYCLYCQTFT